MGKHRIDKNSQVPSKGHNKVGSAPQAPNIKSWGRS
jgi:hypothetical protein